MDEQGEVAAKFIGSIVAAILDTPSTSVSSSFLHSDRGHPFDPETTQRDSELLGIARALVQAIRGTS